MSFAVNHTYKQLATNCALSFGVGFVLAPSCGIAPIVGGTCCMLQPLAHHVSQYFLNKYASATKSTTVATWTITLATPLILSSLKGITFHNPLSLLALQLASLGALHLAREVKIIPS